MSGAIVQFVAAAGVIVAAGVVLAHCADRIAEITRLGRLVIGTVLLASATSLPELAVDVSAVRQGHPDLAVGDLLGSSLMNLLILAVLDLTSHSRGKMLSRTAAGHALSGSMSIALTAIVGFGLVAAGHYTDPCPMHVSLPCWAILFGYLFGARMVFLDQRLAVAAAKEAAAELGEPPPAAHDRRQLWKPAAGFIAAAVVLVIAGPHLACAADRLATLTGLAKTFVGTTLLALSTSLPELVASITAIRLRALDLVVGNVFGSNTFNMVLIVVLDAVHAGPLFAAVSPVHVISCLATIVVTAVAVMGQLYHVESRRHLVEPDAWLMLLLIVGALGAVYRLSG